MWRTSTPSSSTALLRSVSALNPCARGLVGYCSGVQAHDDSSGRTQSAAETWCRKESFVMAHRWSAPSLVQELGVLQQCPA